MATTERNDEMDINALMRPFEPSQIRKRPGPNNRPFSYVSGPDVIGRLLDATGNCFSWKVEKVELVSQETDKGLVTYWVVAGMLSLGSLGVRSGVGTHSADSVEAAKAAETDALKRAAVKFGVGLDLYTEDNSASSGGNGNGKNGASSRENPERRGSGYAQNGGTNAPRSGATARYRSYDHGDEPFE